MLNLSTHELLRCRLKLKDEVIVIPQRQAGSVTYQFQSASQGRYFSVGPAEYLLCSLLDGRTTLAEALTLSARILGTEAFTEHEAIAICSWLVDAGLAEPMSAQGMSAGQSVQPKSRWSFNPFWMKFPLLNPDQLVQGLLPILGWVFTPVMLLLALLLWAWTGVVLASHWEEFTSSSRQLFAPENWLWMGLIWIMLKVIHEFGHAIACRRYGGEVREMGLVFILFAPIAFVDVTTSWSFPSRWKRIQVAAGGMFVELIVASLAVLAWTQVTEEWSRFLLYNIAFMSGLTTLLFNANPLMRFDGYYILSDLVRIPNLYSKGASALSAWCQWICFGRRSTLPELVGWAGRGLLAYGLATALWKTLVTASLLIAAGVLFEGAGIILAAFGAVLFLLLPLMQLVATFYREWQQNRWGALRGLVISSGLLTLLGAVLFGIPCPGTAQAPGIVEYQNLVIVRPKAAGFVTKVHVTEGQLVEPGMLLVELANEELQVEVQDLQLAIEQSRSRQRGYQNQREIAATQVEARNEQALAERLRDRQERLDALAIVATHSGRVIGDRLEELEGTWLDAGAELLALGRENSKEVLVSIRQDALEAASGTVGTVCHLRLSGVGTITGKVERLNPRASLRSPHPALNAVFGGDLPVVIQQDSEDDQADYQLTEPRFLLTVQLDEDVSQQVQAGQRAALRLGFGSRTIAQVVYQATWRWFREQLRQQQA